MSPFADERRLVRAALAWLHVDRLVVTVHDGSFPAGDDDVGRGSPYGRAAAEFFAFLAARGFDGVQFGPQGKTSRHNPSPYDGAALARSPLSVALGSLCDGEGLAGLLRADELAGMVAGRASEAAARVDHRHAFATIPPALARAHQRFRAEPSRYPAVRDSEAEFLRRNGDWLADDDLFEILTAVHGHDDVAAWPALDRRLFAPAPGEEAAAAARRRKLHASHGDVAAFNQFCQLLLDVQHVHLRERAGDLGLRLWADLQVGLSTRDRWRHAGLFLPGYALGAPPSRTNPAGQAWGYPIIDPAGWGDDPAQPGPGQLFFARRLERLFDDFDGLRIDHPHGLICPWVYRADGADALSAVRDGARLFASPDLPEHPSLARHAIVTRGDLAPAAEGRPRHADDWVRRLDDAQIARYARQLDLVMAIAAAHDVPPIDVFAEVLSTCPYPVAQVLARHGLGRLRVVQKADPDDLDDPYRSSEAAPADWITLGTHDTRPIWPVLDEWVGSPRAGAWARYLADRLAPDEARHAAMRATLPGDPRALALALTADLFVGPARHVSLFVSDLLGERETYNVPGTFTPANWTLRVRPDYATAYASDRAAGRALDLPRALALALRARVRAQSGEALDLAAALEKFVSG